MSRSGIAEEAAETTPIPIERAETSETSPREPATPGGSRELLTLALPLVVSQSFMTVQVFVDTILLAWHDPREMAASFPAVMWFWLPFGLLQVTAGYVSTFVAQYTGRRPAGAGRAGGLARDPFRRPGRAPVPAHGPGGPVPDRRRRAHARPCRRSRSIYLRCLCFAALPMLVMAAVNGFFSGRGQTWTVLGIEAAGTGGERRAGPGPDLRPGRLSRAGDRRGRLGDRGRVVDVGRWSPSGCCCGAKYREEFNTLRGWRLERELFGRLMKYGGPAGAQVFLDVLVFHVFVQLVGRLGEAATGATTLTVRLNMVAFLPMMGLGQAVSILVGQRLGADRPDLAERSAYTGLKWVFGYMCMRGRRVPALPGRARGAVRGRPRPGELRRGGRDRPDACWRAWPCTPLADSVNVTFSFALRGRGRHPVRLAAHVRAGLADHGGADVRGRPGRRQHLLGLGVRDGVHRRHGRLLLPAVPVRQVEDHAGDRGGDGGGGGRGTARGVA